MVFSSSAAGTPMSTAPLGPSSSTRSCVASVLSVKNNWILSGGATAAPSAGDDDWRLLAANARVAAAMRPTPVRHRTTTKRRIDRTRLPDNWTRLARGPTPLAEPHRCVVRRSEQRLTTRLIGRPRGVEARAHQSSRRAALPQQGGAGTVPTQGESNPATPDGNVMDLHRLTEPRIGKGGEQLDLA